MMIKITESIASDEHAIELRSIYATGPGGQHLNKTRTAVQLHFDIDRAATLPPPVRQRLIELAGNRVSKELKLVITARRYRSRERNRQDAMQRLFKLIRQAATPPKPRIKRRRPAKANRKRLEAKRKVAEKKAQRRSVAHE